MFRSSEENLSFDSNRSESMENDYFDRVYYTSKLPQYHVKPKGAKPPSEYGALLYLDKPYYRMLCGLEDGSVLVLPVVVGRKKPFCVKIHESGPITDLVWVGDQFWSVSEDKSVVCCSLESYKGVKEFRLGYSIKKIVICSEDRLLSLTSNNELLYFDLSNLRVLRRIHSGSLIMNLSSSTKLSSIQKSVFFDHHIYVSSDNCISLVDYLGDEVEMTIFSSPSQTKRKKKRKKLQQITTMNVFKEEESHSHEILFVGAGEKLYFYNCSRSSLEDDSQAAEFGSQSFEEEEKFSLGIVRKTSLREGCDARCSLYVKNHPNRIFIVGDSKGNMYIYDLKKEKDNVSLVTIIEDDGITSMDSIPILGMQLLFPGHSSDARCSSSFLSIAYCTPKGSYVNFLKMAIFEKKEVVKILETINKKIKEKIEKDFDLERIQHVKNRGKDSSRIKADYDLIIRQAIEEHQPILNPKAAGDEEPNNALKLSKKDRRLYGNQVRSFLVGFHEKIRSPIPTCSPMMTEYYFGQFDIKSGFRYDGIIPQGLGVIYTKKKNASFTDLRKIGRSMKIKANVKFVGEFRNGLIHGMAREFDDKHSYCFLVFMGEYRSGKRHGLGREYHPLSKIFGHIFSGQFRNGKRHGKGIMISMKDVKKKKLKNQDVTIIKGIWEKGELVKEFLQYRCPDIHYKQIIELRKQNLLNEKTLLGSGGFGRTYEVETKKIPDLVKLGIKDEKVAVKISKNQQNSSQCEKDSNWASLRKASELLHLIDNPEDRKYFTEVYATFKGHKEVGIFLKLAKFSIKDMIRLSLTSSSKIHQSHKIKILKETAYGMRALHKLGAMHRDLKWGNILLGFDNVVKICDFDTMKEDEYEYKMKDHALENSLDFGTLGYSAPELFTCVHKMKHGKNFRNSIRGPIYTKKCDVFSYGMMIYSLLMGELDPFRTQYACCCGKKVEDMVVTKNPPRFELVEHMFFHDFRPLLNKQMIQDCFQRDLFLIDLMTSCWNNDMYQRPSFEEIVKIFENEEKNLKGYYTIKFRFPTHPEIEKRENIMKGGMKMLLVDLKRSEITRFIETKFRNARVAELSDKLSIFKDDTEKYTSKKKQVIVISSDEDVQRLIEQKDKKVPTIYVKLVHKVKPKRKKRRDRRKRKRLEQKLKHQKQHQGEEEDDDEEEDEGEEDEEEYDRTYGYIGDSQKREAYRRRNEKKKDPFSIEPLKEYVDGKFQDIRQIALQMAGNSNDPRLAELLRVVSKSRKKVNDKFDENEKNLKEEASIMFSAMVYSPSSSSTDTGYNSFVFTPPASAQNPSGVDSEYMVSTGSFDVEVVDD